MDDVNRRTDLDDDALDRADGPGGPLCRVVSEALAPLVRLGVQVERRGLGTVGVEIEEVLAGGPAAMAGLHRGDTITAVAGRPAMRLDQLAELLEAAGAPVSVAYLDSAGGQHFTTVRVAGERPARHAHSVPARGGFVTNARPDSSDE